MGTVDVFLRTRRGVGLRFGDFGLGIGLVFGGVFFLWGFLWSSRFLRSDGVCRSRLRVGYIKIVYAF